MMTIPFFVLTIGLAAILRGHRIWALILWAVALLAIAILFRIHTTSQLGLGL